MSIRPLSTSLLRRAIFAAALLLVPLSGLTGTASAAEQIVLPFDCNVVGGRVQVRPSSDQAYRIFGARRQEPYRACSERNPERCRTFIVQRFTMACGRDRAEWPEVYAAIAKITDGRAFFNSDGRLYYRMGPREDRDAYPFPQARPATGIVEMPDGFAPVAGVEAIFTPLDPRVAELQDVAPSEPRAYLDPPSAVQPPFVPDEKPGRVEPPQAAAPKPAAPPNAQPKLAEQPKSQVILEPKPSATKAAEPQPEAKPGAPTAAPAASSPAPVVAAPPDPAKAANPAAGASSVMPTILNSPAAKKVEDASKTETVVAAAEIPPDPQSAATSDRDARVEGWSATGPAGLSVPPLAIAAVIAAATLAILLVILKRQSEAPLAAGPLRVPVEPTLPGFEPAPTAAGTQAITLHHAPDPPALSAAPAKPPSGIPATREDALVLLGLSSGASDAAIRKVVEALRQSWHPDLAADEPDRAAREERIKAINVAAGLLLRKSAA